ncbi:MAG: winged helix-turn-helix transcriptional regulator [Parabacteroides sp.]|nr:winged helix-turn-helix transcriptional regulator [Parabacteroides sp.]
MVKQELDILKVVAENPLTSQRMIAEKTGVSLGQVNFLMKKCVKKGLIKIEGQTPKSLRYNLTPKGMAEKAERTLQYIKVSYAAVKKLSSRISELGQMYKDRGHIIYLAGKQDEMMEICILALNDAHIGYQVGIPADNVKNAVLFYWEPEMVDQYESYTCVNILAEE